MVPFAFLPLALFGCDGAGAGVVVGFAGRVEDETRLQWVAWGLRLLGELVVEPMD